MVLVHFGGSHIPEGKCKMNIIAGVLDTVAGLAIVWLLSNIAVEAWATYKQNGSQVANLIIVILSIFLLRPLYLVVYDLLKLF